MLENYVKVVATQGDLEGHMILNKAHKYIYIYTYMYIYIYILPPILKDHHILFLKELLSCDIQQILRL